jgi:hypothetical protein
MECKEGASPEPLITLAVGAALGIWLPPRDSNPDMLIQRLPAHPSPELPGLHECPGISFRGRWLSARGTSDNTARYPTPTGENGSNLIRKLPRLLPLQSCPDLLIPATVELYQPLTATHDLWQHEDEQ